MNLAKNQYISETCAGSVVRAQLSSQIQQSISFTVSSLAFIPHHHHHCHHHHH